MLHRFSDVGDGKLPSAGLIQDSGGNLYGTTSGGEDAGSYGTVFKLDRTGVLSVLYSFTGGVDGGKPYAGLLRDPAGILYGTTESGGGTPCTSSDGFKGRGIVFKLTPPVTFCRTIRCPWTETVLYRFQGGSDGQNPDAGLILDSAGNLYGAVVCSDRAQGQRLWSPVALQRFA